MRRLTLVLPFLLVAILAAVPFLAQQQNASVSGKVVGRDGTTPVQGAVIQIDSLATNNGRLTIRERLTTKTGRNGEYSLSGLYQGRVRIAVMENNQEIMSKGEKVGDEIFLAAGIDYRANFDLSKAPPPAPGAPAAGAAAPTPSNTADREALRKKLEEEAAAAGEVSKAFDAGKAAMTAKDYAAAVESFKTAVAKSPTPVHILYANLGRALDSNKQYAEAETAYKKAIELMPTESNYFLNLSLAQIALGNLADSEASIKKAAELNPANAGQAYYNLGATLINRNKNQEAIGPLTKAIELDPKYAPAYYQLGLSLIGLGKLDEAPQYLQKCIDLGNCPDVETAKALIDATKATGPQIYTSPEGKARAEAEAKAAEAAKSKNNKAATKGKNQ